METVVAINIAKTTPSFRREKISENNGISITKSITQVMVAAEIYSWRDIPILIVTAVYTRPKYSYQAKEVGANAFLIKPFKAKALVDEVQRLLQIKIEKIKDAPDKLPVK